MKHALLAFLLLAAPLAAADSEVNRKLLKPGLIGAYTESGAAGSKSYRLEPTVALVLKPGESATARGATTHASWQGYLQIVTAGPYEFTAVVEGGTPTVILSRGGKTVDVLTTKPATLEPGVYQFEAKFTLSPEAKEHRFALHWQGPGFRKEPVPHYFFGHLPEQRTQTIEPSLAVDHGRFLFEETGCKNCHQPKDDALGKLFVDRNGPNLSDIGQRVYPGWLNAWLADPTKLRPNTVMPKMFTDDERGTAERYAVVQYLVSLGGPLKTPRLPTISKEWSRNISNGEKLFTTTGCATCHGKQLAATAKKSEDDEDEIPVKFEPSSSFHGLGTATGSQSLYALGALGSKTTPEHLQNYLKDPLKTNPHGRMPNMQLTNDEARDLARHLYRSTDESFDRQTVKEPKLQPGDFDEKSWISLGKKLMTSKGCVNCHTVSPGGQTLAISTAAPSLRENDKADRPIAQLGCLADQPDAKKVPLFPFDATQRAAIRAFVGDGLKPSAPSPLVQARTALKRFNCLNCHKRDGEGGIGTELADQMKKLENAENADDVAPPQLTGIGHKAKTSWLESVLLHSGRARPWMSLRMPQYGPQNVGHLPVALAHLEGTLPDSTMKKVVYTPEKLEAGRTLNGSNGLGCIKCHDISGHVGGGTRGPDLARTSERLRLEWYERWMHNPQRLAPGTKMPQNFNYGKSAFDKLLGGSADAQIEAIWAYLSLGPGLPLPAGMEPPRGLIVTVGQKPEVLRTFLPDGASTRAIAVGFPSNLSFAFDAHACKVSYAWEGNFLDASPVWNNRGGNQAKLLGPKFLTPPPVQSWAITASRTPPDYDKRANDYAFGAPVPIEKIYQGPSYVHFDGYSLREDGVPVFRYRVGEPDEKAQLAIRETITPNKGSVAVGLTREFELTVPAMKTPWLLVGETSGTPRLLTADRTEVFSVKDAGTEQPAADTKLVLPDGSRATVILPGELPPGTMWRFVSKSGGGWQAILRLPEVKDASTVKLRFTAWSSPKDEPGIIQAIGK